jgi:hypothetical protein
MSSETFDDKAETVTADRPKPAKTIRLFPRRARQERLTDDENGSINDANKVNSPVSKTIRPVGITELFRYIYIIG